MDENKRFKSQACRTSDYFDGFSIGADHNSEIQLHVVFLFVRVLERVRPFLAIDNLFILWVNRHFDHIIAGESPVLDLRVKSRIKLIVGVSIIGSEVAPMLRVCTKNIAQIFCLFPENHSNPNHRIYLSCPESTALLLQELRVLFVNWRVYQCNSVGVAILYLHFVFVH